MKILPLHYLGKKEREVHRPDRGEGKDNMFGKSFSLGGKE